LHKGPTVPKKNPSQLKDNVDFVDECEVMQVCNANSAHIVEGSGVATHIHERDMGIITDHFMFSFGS